MADDPKKLDPLSALYAAMDDRTADAMLEGIEEATADMPDVVDDPEAEDDAAG